MRSVNIVPVFEKKNIKRVTADWKHKFQLSFFSTVRVYFGGYEAKELELVSAENSVSGKINDQLAYTDMNYAKMDSSSFIILKFRCSDEKPQQGMKRDFVLIVNGKSFKNNWNYDISDSHNVKNQSEDLHYQYKLFDNYPNPFNPRTVIRYNISAGKNIFKNVKLLIYDALGKEAAVLVNKRQSAGSYSVTFDGSNLPSGIYFYKLQTDDFNAVKKMVLLK